MRVQLFLAVVLLAAGLAGCSSSPKGKVPDGPTISVSPTTGGIRGLVVDLAVGIIIGTAFGAIVKSLVDDVIMPVAGVLLGGVDYSNHFYVIKGNPPDNATTVEAARAAGASVVAYGKFVNNILTFIIVALAVFFLVKAINRMRRRRQKHPEPTAMTRPCPECTTEIPKAAKRCSSCTSPVPPLPPPPAT